MSKSKETQERKTGVLRIHMERLRFSLPVYGVGGLIISGMCYGRLADEMVRTMLVASILITAVGVLNWLIWREFVPRAWFYAIRLVVRILLLALQLAVFPPTVTAGEGWPLWPISLALAAVAVGQILELVRFLRSKRED